MIELLITMWDFISKITFGEIINAVILAITAIIVFLYTKAAQKSNEIREKPILNLYLRKGEIGPNLTQTLHLRNVGSGPAYNIYFTNIRTKGNYIYTPDLDEPNPILERDGVEKPVNFYVGTPNGSVEIYDNILGFRWFTSRLFPEQTPEEKREQLKRNSAIFLIHYKGVNDKQYYSIFRLYSKIWPDLDLVVEFIQNGNGECDMDKAQRTCAKIKTMENSFTLCRDSGNRNLDNKK